MQCSTISYIILGEGHAANVPPALQNIKRTYSRKENKMNITLETVNRILSKGFVHNASNDAIIADLNAMNTTEADVAEYAASKAFTEHGEGFHALRDLKRYMKQKRGGAPAKARAPRAPKAPKEAPKKDAPKEEPKKEEPKMPPHFEPCKNVVTIAKRPLLMVGPAGTGKSYTAEKIAEACGATAFYSQDKISFETDLKGYMDAYGHYVATSLYRAMKRADGGEKTAFFLDEIFAGDTSCLTVINGLLSDRKMTFPNEETLSAENLILLAADNTNGNGATNQYNTRNKADKSFLNRFGVVRVDYDKDVEKTLANGHADILEYVRTMRAAAEKNDIDIVLSYRTIESMAAYADAGISAAESVNTYVYQDALTEDDKDTLRQDAKIARLIAKGNQYALAM